MYLLPDSSDKKLSKGLLSIVNESRIPYASKHKVSLEGIADLLENKLLLSLVIQAGLPFELFDLIQSSTPFSELEWAGFLGISTKSIQRYKNENKTFKPLQSEKILEITEVCILGYDIFDSQAKFLLWLSTPCFALGEMEPIQLLKDSYGKDLVMTELVRLDHGIFI